MAGNGRETALEVLTACRKLEAWSDGSLKAACRRGGLDRRARTVPPLLRSLPGAARQERKSVKEAAVQGQNDLPSQASVFEAVSKTTCFAGENNLISFAK